MGAGKRMLRGDGEILPKAPLPPGEGGQLATHQSIIPTKKNNPSLPHQRAAAAVCGPHLATLIPTPTRVTPAEDPNKGQQ